MSLITGEIQLRDLIERFHKTGAESFRLTLKGRNMDKNHSSIKREDRQPFSPLCLEAELDISIPYFELGYSANQLCHLSPGSNCTVGKSTVILRDLAGMAYGSSEFYNTLEVSLAIYAVDTNTALQIANDIVYGKSNDAKKV